MLENKDGGQSHKETVMANSGSIIRGKITEKINRSGSGGVLHNHDYIDGADKSKNIQNERSPAESRMIIDKFQKMEAANHKEAPMANSSSITTALKTMNNNSDFANGVLHNH